MDKKKLILIILAIVILSIIIALIIIYYKNKSADEALLISDPRRADRYLKIPSEKLPKMNDKQEYTYSMWFFVSSWENNHQAKNIFFRGNASQSGNIYQVTEASPNIWIYPQTNNLFIRTEFSNAGSGNRIPAVDEPSDRKCDIQNFPLQKWVNLTIVLFNKTMDVYINGKLTRSCIYHDIPKISQGDLHIAFPHIGTVCDLSNNNCPAGFDGFISRFRAYNHAITPEDIYQLYLDGPVSALWWLKDLQKSLTPDIDLSICKSDQS